MLILYIYYIIKSIALCYNLYLYSEKISSNFSGEKTEMKEVKREKYDLSHENLAKAISTKNLSHISKFIEGGFDFNINFESRMSPLVYAVAYGNFEIVKVIADYPNTDINYTPNEWAPLHTAVNLGHPKIVKLFLEKGADPALRINGNESPIEIAYKKMKRKPMVYEQIISLLSKYLTKKDIFLLTVNGDVDGVIDALRDDPGLASALNVDGHTIFQLAAIHDQIDILKALVENYSKTIPNLNYPELLSALFSLAAKNESRTAFLYLLSKFQATIPISELQRGYDIVLRSRNNVLAVDLISNLSDEKVGELNHSWAYKLGNKELLTGLIKKGGSIPLWANSRLGDEELIKQAIENRIDLNSADDNGNTSLFYSINYRKTNALKLLLGAGASVNHYRISDGYNPLHFAVEKGYLDGVILLSDYYDNIDVACQRTNRSPLYISVLKGYYSIAKYLLEKGADPHYLPSKNSTPIKTIVRNDEKFLELIEKYL